MSDPQPRRLKNKPARAEPWQPDRPGAGEPAAQDEASSDGPRTPRRPAAGYGKPQDTEAAVSAEAAIPRDPQNGQALNDKSLTSGKDSEQSDGASGSMHLPPS